MTRRKLDDRQKIELGGWMVQAQVGTLTIQERLAMPRYRTYLLCLLSAALFMCQVRPTPQLNRGTVKQPPPLLTI